MTQSNNLGADWKNSYCIYFRILKTYQREAYFVIFSVLKDTTPLCKCYVAVFLKKLFKKISWKKIYAFVLASPVRLCLKRKVLFFLTTSYRRKYQKIFKDSSPNENAALAVRTFHNSHREKCFHTNPFQANNPFSYSLKKSEKCEFSNVLRGYRNGALTWDGITQKWGFKLNLNLQLYDACH